MARFQTKPTEVEAWRFERGADRPAFLAEAISRGAAWLQGHEDAHCVVKTAWGETRVNAGDWIVRMPSGELKAYRSDEFLGTYEAKD